MLNAEQENQHRTKLRGSGAKDAQNSSYRERVVSMSLIGKVASTLASQGPGSSSGLNRHPGMGLRPPGSLWGAAQPAWPMGWTDTRVAAATAAVTGAE